MERLYCPHCGAGHFATDRICLNCEQALRADTPTPDPIPPSPITESQQERRLIKMLKIGGSILLAAFALWFCRIFGPGTLVILPVPVLLAWLWDWNDTRKEEERGRRILAAGRDKAAVQAELARYHSDNPRMVQTRYGLYEVSAFDSRLGPDTSGKDTQK